MIDTLERYYSLPKAERTRLRRAMFGIECMPEHERLRQLLIEENEQTGWFPERWVDSEAVEDSAE